MGARRPIRALTWRPPSLPVCPINPPKPPSRPDKVSLWRYLRLFRHDILSAQPAKLYRAWMAEFRTPFFRSFLANDPSLVKLVLKDRPDDFPKSDRVGAGLRPLLGQSVFLTNGEVWKRQRRIIDSAFEGGRLRDTYGAMYAAGQAAVARLQAAKVSEILNPRQAIWPQTLFSAPCFPFPLRMRPQPRSLQNSVTTSAHSRS